MNYAEIKKIDVANGTGIRVSLFVSGCTHHCKGCFNSIAWSFDYGKEFTKDTEKEIIEALKPYYISGLSLLGGEPFEISNQFGLINLLKRVKKEYPDKTIWCYSGYLLDDILPGGKIHTEVSDELLSYIDVLVDGEFVEELKDITLIFKGSSNQRIIDLNKTLKEKKVVLFEVKKGTI